MTALEIVLLVLLLVVLLGIVVTWLLTRRGKHVHIRLDIERDDSDTVLDPNKEEP